MHFQWKDVLASLAIITISNSHPPLFANAQGLSCLESIDRNFNESSISASTNNLFLSSLVTATVTSESNTISTSKDYSNVKKRLLQNFERACLSMGNTTSCSISESMEKGDFVYTVMEKPVCVAISAENSDCPMDGSASASAITSSDSSTELMEAQEEMESVFEECVDILFGGRQNRCEITTTELEEISEYNVQADFSSYLETEDGMAMKSSCMAKNLTMCSVTTVAMDGDIELYEIAKPMCLPSTCTGMDPSDIAFLDPNPLCDKNCDVISQSLTCDSSMGEMDTSEDSCFDDADAIFGDVELGVFYDEISSALTLDCDAALQGESTAMCSITPPLEKTVNITELDADLVSDAMESCIELGMDACYFTGTSLSSTRDMESFSKEFTVYDQYPICIPSECADNLDDLLNIVLPTFSTSPRTFEIEDLVCGLTLSPSQSMVPSSTPSTVSSDAPTLMSSSSPSFSPSITSSSSPSLTNSMPPSSHPTAAETIIVTTSPTESPKVTDAPSIPPTMEPTTPSPTMMTTTMPPVETSTDAPDPISDDLVAPSSDSVSRWRLSRVSVFLGGVVWMFMTL